jgi:hypothetical protein
MFLSFSVAAQDREKTINRSDDLPAAVDEAVAAQIQGQRFVAFPYHVFVKKGGRE